jgi:hypothetical protein
VSLPFTTRESTNALRAGMKAKPAITRPRAARAGMKQLRSMAEATCRPSANLAAGAARKTKKESTTMGVYCPITTSPCGKEMCEWWIADSKRCCVPAIAAELMCDDGIDEQYEAYQSNFGPEDN